ncbi:uncharacterized protein LY79DRAFT_309644 [Colletotrichum navitas]|uniref:Uncharacterized protein n=1 Tax=Colletotrichum navitas TaxID=681940 RepID=A0AAD8V336_9PEZI|nr:uncharacterized protein LY79DRAFT_309644 [Colletotrichum navitas]KAK1580313.1 hypothetical protein LY79DRAFT_309644 [Colletotrichum navitas]
METSLLARSSGSCLLLRAAVTKELYMILGPTQKSWKRVWIFDRSMRFWSKGGVFFYKSRRERLPGPTTKQHGQHRLGFCLLARCLLLGEGLGKGWEVFCLSIPCGFSGNREPGFCCAYLIFVFVARFFRTQSFPAKERKGSRMVCLTAYVCFMFR